MYFGQKTALCMRCTALLGAGPSTEPHQYLQPAGYLPGGVLHRCTRCFASSLAKPQGWARTEDVFDPAD